MFDLRIIDDDSILAKLYNPTSKINHFHLYHIIVISDQRIIQLVQKFVNLHLAIIDNEIKFNNKQVINFSD